MLTAFVPRRNFNSLLEFHRRDTTTNATLWLIVHVYFERYEPVMPHGGLSMSDHPANVHDVSRNSVTNRLNPDAVNLMQWTDIAFSRFCRQFETSAERVWNDRLWLRPCRDGDPEQPVSWGMDAVGMTECIRQIFAVDCASGQFSNRLERISSSAVSTARTSPKDIGQACNHTGGEIMASSTTATT